MTFSRGGQQFTICYNGELYNAPELKSELLELGYQFETECDTEVLLKSYAEWGADCLKKLNGIFAFVIYEKHKKRLFIARDRMGVKPFFYSLKDGIFAFSSEIKGLLEMPHIKPTIDLTSISELILIAPGRTSGYGVFKEISELKPAYFGYFTNGILKIESYWSLVDKPFTDSEDEAVEKVRYLVTDSIKRQLVSDVPIATFLSGGLDSSLISSIADRECRENGKTLTTFSVTYKDNERDFQQSRFLPENDNIYIKKMNDYLNAEHFDIIIDTPELVTALYTAVDARDLPGMADVDASLLLLCKEIRKKATVALSGECADEIFGGYPWFTDPEISSRNGFPWAQTTQWRYSFLNDNLQKLINPNEYVLDKYNKTIAETHILDGIDNENHRKKEMTKLNMDWFMQTLLDVRDTKVNYCFSLIHR